MYHTAISHTHNYQMIFMSYAKLINIKSLSTCHSMSYAVISCLFMQLLRNNRRILAHRFSFSHAEHINFKVVLTHLWKSYYLMPHAFCRKSSFCNFSVADLHQILNTREPFCPASQVPRVPGFWSLGSPIVQFNFIVYPEDSFSLGMWI